MIIVSNILNFSQAYMERDILEANRLAEANQRRFEEITEYTGEFVWEVDINGVFTYVNRAAERMLGYSQIAHNASKSKPLT